MLYVSALPSTSLPVRVMGSAVSSAVETDCALAVGGSFTGVTVNETVAGAESTWPSFTLKVKLSGPL